MSKEKYGHLPLKAVRFSIRNMLYAFNQSPFGKPGFKIGEVVGANTVKVGDNIITIDDIDSKKVLDYGTRVIVYRQGSKPDFPNNI